MPKKSLIAGAILLTVAAAALFLAGADAKALIFKISNLKPTFTGNVFVFKHGLFNFRFSRSFSKKSFQTCPEIVNLCEEEYKKCRGLIDQQDQSSDEALLDAKNACVYSCDAPPAYCFGLVAEGDADDNSGQTKLCNENEKTRNCVDADGRAGTQSAKYCDTAVGVWIFGECIIKSDGYEPPPITQCQGSQPSCPTGYVGSYVCSEGQWVSNCQQIQQSCEGSAPSCPSGYSGSYVCQNGNWVSQCQPPSGGGGSNCPELDPDWRVCMMSDGRYGREYTDYCNESTGEWVWRLCNVYINLQPTCTSFTYTEWSSCSNSGNQSRTILTREPYGCAGGDPVTYQTCCQGAEPSCPTGWSGSYTCSNNTWWNTCTPNGTKACYRGVTHHTGVTGESGCPNCTVYAKCVGVGSQNGQACMVNDCGSLQPWIPFSSESAFQNYVDTIYSDTIPNSCDPNFTYGQCN